MKIALSPLNLILGDWEGNLKLHQERIAEAAKMGANLVVFPELSLPGYLPLDLLMRPSWVGNAEKQLDRLQSWLLKNYPDLAVVVGTTCCACCPSVGARSARWRSRAAGSAQPAAGTCG